MLWARACRRDRAGRQALTTITCASGTFLNTGARRRPSLTSDARWRRVIATVGVAANDDRKNAFVVTTVRCSTCGSGAGRVFARR